MTRFAGQQIIGFLNEAEAGIPVKELCRTHGFGDAAFCGWRSESGGLQVNEGRRLREPEFGNAKLKKRLAEAHLDVEALKVAFGAKTPAPQAKRQAVERMRQGLSISKCRAWGLAGLARTTMRREVAETAQNEALKVRIVDLARARALIGQWRRDYNEVRPHGSPGRIPPADFAAPHRPNPSDAAQTATTNSSCNHGLC